jgi:class 3 adenylate cyclase
MRCPRCEEESPPRAKFCFECGAPLARTTCPNCSVQLPAFAKFCPECAHPVARPAAAEPRFAAPDSYTPKHLAEKILTSKSALEGERKLVTVLFADLKGSMELLAGRDPEEARKILDPVLKRMMEAVHRYEGTVTWGGKTSYSQLRLDALPAESAAELLEALLGDDPGLTPLKQRLVKRGNPFFLEETVRTLVETKALAGERGRYRLTQPFQTIKVAATVQAMLAARIDRLPPEDRRLLQTACVVGKDVTFALLQAIAELGDGSAARAGPRSLWRVPRAGPRTSPV